MNSSPTYHSSRTQYILASLIILAAILVHIRSLLFPMLLYDDFGIVLSSWTWERTYSNLWTPVNEHSWPLTRLATYGIIQLAGRPTFFPLTAVAFSHLLQLVVMALTYRFIHRERGHPFFGLIAMAVFGISAAYQEAIDWYAASPAMAALAFGLMALLAAQRWERTRSRWALILSAFCCALAPGWFAGGILIGPLCTIYLIGRGSVAKSWLPSLMPLLGSTAYLSVMLPHSGNVILNTDHYNGHSAIQAFSFTSAVENTGRALVDSVLLGSLGVFHCPMPGAIVIAGLVFLAIVWVWRWNRAGDRRLMILGMAFILFNYLLIFGARANWPYAEQLSTWTRYNVFPQLGIAFVVSGALGPRGTMPASGLSIPQIRAIKILILFLFVSQCPRGWFNGPMPLPKQMEILRKVESMDRRCIEHHISADDARRILPAEIVPYSDYNCWLFLRGSPMPRAMNDVELNRILLDR